MNSLDINNLFSVRGKVALVTGGSRGIGEMITAGLLSNGARVYITARKADQCNATAERLSKQYDAECISIPANIADIAGVESLAAELSSRESHLDFLINNAGAAWGAPLESFPEVGWDKVMDTNVKGVFFLTQKVLPLLEARATADDPSRVVNIGSIDGIRPTIFDTQSYGPSKAAVHFLTQQLAAPLARRNILCNAIAPGAFPTWMLSTGIGTGGDVEGTDWSAIGKTSPRGRVGTPEDIAGLAIFLCSRAGQFVCGDVIKCDGGAAIG